MREPITIPAQARALRSLTGLPLAHCKRVLVTARTEAHRGMVMKRRATVAARQLEFAEARPSEDEVRETFAQIRRNLEEVQP